MKHIEQGLAYVPNSTIGLLTLIFNLVKLNSVYSAIDKEGSPHQEDMALLRTIKFIPWYKELKTGIKHEQRGGL